MRTILLTLAYDGSGYCGWQVQPNGVSVQSVVERALAEFTGETMRVTAAGRTDAGVHALGQLASFHTAGEIPPVGFRLGLQTKLPGDVVIRDAVEVPHGFSARYDTVRKTYRYLIQNAPVRTPWLRNYVGWHRTRLDDRAMQAALDVLVGTHDFRSFESSWPNKATSIRTMMAATIQRVEGWDAWRQSGTRSAIGASQLAASSGQPPDVGLDPTCSPRDFLCLDLTADGFLYNMVRTIVGTLIHVGRGNWTADDVRRILAAQDRAAAGETAPPEGLYLLRCDYEINPQRIAARNARTSGRSEPSGLDD